MTSKVKIVAVALAMVTCGAWATTSSVAAAPQAATSPNWQPLSAGPAPTSNPLEGFIPYAGSYSTFPYSMEWFYLPVNAVMSGPSTFNWSAFDAQLGAIASRGHQAALRFYLDYPGKPSGVPQYLWNEGLASHSYTDYGNNNISVSPNYDDPRLDAAIDSFISAFGHRYDGDKRIGFIQLGLLGFWGEWHTYPHDGSTLPENWFASEAEQTRVLYDYQAAFHQTKLQARYPSADNAALNMGYHDDSFAVESLPIAGDWHFMNKAVDAGVTNKWLSEPNGGELRPEIQSCIFDQPADCPVIEGDADNDFPDSVAQEHTSWLLNQTAFDPGYTTANKASALAGSQSMGYQFTVTRAVVQAAGGHTLTVGATIKDGGVAPFYYKWPVQVAAVDSHGTIRASMTTSFDITRVEPGAPQQFIDTFRTLALPRGTYSIVLRVVNPLPNGVPLRFANASQDQTLPGWLTLGTASTN